MYEEKKARHVNSFIKDKIRLMRQRFPLFVENMGENLQVMIAQKRQQVQEKRAQQKARREQARKK